MLTDKEIKALGGELIAPFDASRVGPVCYDVTAAFFPQAKSVGPNGVTLQQNESTFVQCVETINLPADMTAEVHLRNCYIRQGLLLTAPIYYPGHKTAVFFHVTNLSSDPITLKAGDSLASLTFERLGMPVEKPYFGKYQNEFEFFG